MGKDDDGDAGGDGESDDAGSPLDASPIDDEPGGVAPPLSPDALFAPTAANVVFAGHPKSVNTISVNSKGSHMATGGAEGEIHLWDFNGMTSKPTFFRAFSAVAGHSIRCIEFSSSGWHLLVAAGDVHCRIFTANAELEQATVKGDMYVRDAAQTKGHTHGVLSCQWHPFEKDKFLSSSIDSTVRVFDLQEKPYGVDQYLPHIQVVRATDKRNATVAGQLHITVARWAPIGGQFIVGGCSDGSLQFWDLRRNYSKPLSVLRTAHTGDVTGLVVTEDEKRVISRSVDGTVKVWDIRNATSLVAAQTQAKLPTESTGMPAICMSPNERLVAVVTASTDAVGSTLKFLDTSTLEIFHDEPVVASSPSSSAPDTARSSNRDMYSSRSTAPLSSNRESAAFYRGPVCVVWPTSLNQVFTGCVDGSIHAFYDPKYSSKGALLFANKMPSRRQDPTKAAELFGFQEPIFTPDALPPGYKETRSGGIRRVRIGGRRGAASMAFNQRGVGKPPTPALPRLTAVPATMAASFMSTINLSASKDEDPVEAIRRVAAEAEAEPIFTKAAYSKTQPKPVLDYCVDQEDAEELIAMRGKCPKCGLKMCQCGFMGSISAKEPTASKHRRVL